MKKEKGYIFKTEKGNAEVIDFVCTVDSYSMDDCHDVYLCKHNNAVIIVKVYWDSWDGSDIPKIDKIINGVGVM